MPKILNIEVFQFNELGDEAKKKALDEYREFNVEDRGWWDFVYEDWTEKLEAMGFEGISIHFSGFWSQGDGASFTGEVNLEKYLRSQKLCNQYRFLFSCIVNRGWHFCAPISRSGHYYHEHSTDVSIDYCWVDGLTYEQEERLHAQMDDLEKYIKSHMVGLNKKIYYDLEAEYEGLTSDEAVAEALSINEYDFQPSGRMFSYG